LTANKYDLFSGQAKGTQFNKIAYTNTNGIVRWSNMSYNINEKETIRIIGLGSIFAKNEVYQGEASIYCVLVDSPGFLKTGFHTINS
jgi:hypothetical protein